MKSYILDKLHSKFIEKNCKNDDIYFKILYNKLINCKNDIDKYTKKWEKYKKYVNTYEFVYTKYNIYINICNILPISRSYFKLHEMLYDFDIININNAICIAEAPGGFIQCLHDNHNLDNIYGITLLSNDDSVPVWNNKIYKYDNIKLLYGKDNTGDICNLDNIKDIVKNINNKCELITCDGGIDYSINFKNQELDSYEFIYNEILLSLQLQKNDGTLILKIFDIFHNYTIQLIYILYQCYDTIIINKPYTSRNTNSEKYLICKNYKYNKNIIDFLIDNYENKKFNINLPNSFIKDIKYYNNVFVDNQINNINIVLKKILSNDIYIEKPNNLQKNKAIEWCKKYNLDINERCIYL
jgi:23S rRNA U2552 (ribose-2'-O)-methylase RlmE/FtsJ